MRKHRGRGFDWFQRAGRPPIAAVQFNDNGILYQVSQGAASLVGAALMAGAISATPAGAASFEGLAVTAPQGVVQMDGTASAVFQGSGDFQSIFTSDGAATVSLLGRARASVTLLSAGLGAVDFVGDFSGDANADWSADGIALATLEGVTANPSSLSSSGTADAGPIGATLLGGNMISPTSESGDWLATGETQVNIESSTIDFGNADVLSSGVGLAVFEGGGGLLAEGELTASATSTASPVGGSINGGAMSGNGESASLIVLTGATVNWSSIAAQLGEAALSANGAGSLVFIGRLAIEAALIIPNTVVVSWVANADTVLSGAASSSASLIGAAIEGGSMTSNNEAGALIVLTEASAVLVGST